MMEPSDSSPSVLRGKGLLWFFLSIKVYAGERRGSYGAGGGSGARDGVLGLGFASP